MFPLYHPLADATEWEGAEVLACESSDVLAAVGLAVRPADGGTRLLVANLAPREQDVVIAPVSGPLALRRLNESTAAEASSDPAAFRRPAESVEAAGSSSRRSPRTRSSGSTRRSPVAVSHLSRPL